MASEPPARRPRRSPPSRRRAQRSARRHQGSDLLGRVLVAVPAAVVAIVFVDLGGLLFTLFILAIGIVCLHELYELLEGLRPVRLAGFLALAGMLLAALYGNQFEVVLAMVAAVPVTFGLAVASPTQGESTTLSIAATLLGIYWIALALAHAVLLRGLHHGDGIVIDVLVGTFLGDTGAYFGGRWFGRRQLAPRISPNKTVEGLVIGMAVAVAAVFFAGLYQDWLSNGQALLLGLAVALAAPVGDLFESRVKRDADTKDTGRAFGAHGGALDRLDAVLFTAVAAYYVWVALQ